MKRKQQGFSIVELLIAMTLGLVLSAGIIQVFVANRQAQRVEQSVARVQENGRIALELISQDLRMAGSLGCSGVIVNANNSDDRTFTNHVSALTGANNTFDGVSSPVAYANNAVRGFSRINNVWAPALGGGVNAGAIPGARNGSDVLAIYFAENIGVVIQGAAPANGNILVNRPSPNAENCLTQGQIVVVSSCFDADVIAVTNNNSANCGNANLSLAHDLTLNTDNSLKQSAGADSVYSSNGRPPGSASLPRVLAFRNYIYFVANSGRTNAGGTPVMSLFRWDGTRATELVEGIEFLRLEFGEKVNNNIRYITANAVSDWSRVSSVRVGVLAQGFDAVRDADDATNYTIADQGIPAVAGAGQQAHSGGRTLRQAYTTTVELRNRVQ